jgi:hypothetical protein
MGPGRGGQDIGDRALNGDARPFNGGNKTQACLYIIMYRQYL